MEVYSCRRCGSIFDFVFKEPGRLCESCGCPLEHKGSELSVWGEFAKSGP